MLKIGEFSHLARVSVRTLRHYDDLSLLKPAEIDRFTDYRYYRVDQLLRLNRILALKDLGFSLTAIRGMLEDDLPVEQLRGMLRLRRAQLADEISESQARLARVEARLREIEQENTPFPYDVVLKPVEGQSIASLRALVPSLPEMETLRCALYESLYERLDLDRLPPAGSELALYHLEEYAEHDLDMEAAVVVPAGLVASGIVFRDLPALPAVAATVHRGAFADVTRAVQALYHWAGSNGFTTKAPIREWHLFGREIDLDGADFDDVVIEVQLPVVPAVPGSG